MQGIAFPEHARRDCFDAFLDAFLDALFVPDLYGVVHVEFREQQIYHLRSGKMTSRLSFRNCSLAA
jgi:hypothetical protein